MSHVFVSYSKHDKAYALRLVSALLDKGFDVWIDNRRLRSSDDWWRSIVAALRDSAAVVVLMTPASDASEWVQLEITLAIKYKKPRFPLWLSGNIDTPNWDIFARTQFIDVTDGTLPPDSFYDDLAKHVERKAHRGSNVTETGHLDRPVTLGIDPVFDEAIQHPPTQDEAVETATMPAAVQPSQTRLMTVAALLLLLGVIIGVTLLSASPPQMTSTPTSPVTEPLDMNRPVTLELLNQWRGEQGLAALTSQPLLQAIAERQMSYLISLPVSELDQLPNYYRDAEGRDAQEIATQEGYGASVQMAVEVLESGEVTLNDLVTRLEIEGEANVHQRFSQVGWAQERSPTTNLLILVVLLGSGETP